MIKLADIHFSYDNNKEHDKKKLKNNTDICTQASSIANQNVFKNISVKTGENILLRCPIHSFPAAKVLWYKINSVNSEYFSDLLRPITYQSILGSSSERYF